MATSSSALDMTNPVVAAVAPKLADPSQRFALSVGLECTPDRRAEMEDLFIRTTPPTRAEDGCWQYLLTRDVEHEYRYLLSEGWADLASLDAHFKTEHGRTLLAELSPLLAAAFTITVLAPVEG